ncbi:hypothetical protein MCOR02_000254 [Pyricularia oryzae]|nr:hypothetical protein MCOR02_000254 [Pyricularia oryzae]KAI6306659.1 hypothetical protein MCOR34_007913 [Pyricularia oryzae]KAI6566748.1 hypothetical protein MCOR09_006355 [Pyricularia oryzae]KAI6632285.1 hypothetical protein MCOR08_005572 [Pyricularia oryzae]
MYQIRYKETYSQIAARPVHVFVRFIPRFGTVLCKLEKDVRDIQGSWCWGNPHATTYQIQRLVANANTAAFASELIYLGQPLHFGAATGDPGLAGIKNSGLSHLWLTWLKKCKKVAQPGNRRQGCYRMDQRTGSGRVGSPVGKSAGSITERASQSAEKEVISKLYKKRPRQRPRNRISILWWTTLGKRNAVRVAIKQPVQRAVFDVETSDGVPECRSPCVCHNESLAVPKPSADPHESRGLGGD